MGDFLDVLARDARKTIDREYYETVKPAERVRISLMKAILESKANPIITEIKTASPSAGVIRTNVKAGIIAKAMAKGGATAISVLTEPIHFSGSLEALTEA
ncbi:MAG TPA: indole-3-glycerol-phosphate synthase, partial [Verrucomicrobiae bacterium]|nr:indole-3-glycerol-phosphate synthase [Verrucomicrobiae bacterium]